MTIDGITHVTLPVSDLEASSEFYETVLEATPLGPSEGEASIESADSFWFEVADGQFIILTVVPDTGSTAGSDTDGRIVSFRTDESDLVGLRARLDALGHSYSESRTTLTFSDPDDNRLEVTTGVEPP